MIKFTPEQREIVTELLEEFQEAKQSEFFVAGPELIRYWAKEPLTREQILLVKEISGAKEIIWAGRVMPQRGLRESRPH